MLSVETPTQPPSGMTAIAKVDTMLELVPVSHDAKAMLERILPIYDASAAVFSPDEATSLFLSHSTPLSRSALLSEIVAPDSVAEQAWRALLAFEFQGRCARPAASTALAVWQSVVNYAALERVDLVGLVDFTRFFETEQAPPIDEPVGEAILRCLEDRNVPTSTSRSMRLDRQNVVCWVGLTLLQARAEQPGFKPHLLITDFITQWQDLLLEAWREDAALDQLPEGCYTVEGEHIIICGDRDGSGSERPQLAAASGEAKSTAGKRKWHDKFKAQRKEIKK
jgi:sister chromatid cohesion protein DCC1